LSLYRLYRDISCTKATNFYSKIGFTEIHLELIVSLILGTDRQTDRQTKNKTEYIFSHNKLDKVNPLTPTVAIRVQL